MSVHVFTEDVQINYTAPSYQFNGTESGQIYHEDTELSGIMYRAKNATYQPTPKTWHQQDNTKASYCMTQELDGTVRYYYQPPDSTTDWPTWETTDAQEFYAVNYGLDAADMSGSVNTPALQAAIAAALTNGGGVVRLPAGIFNLNAAIVIDFSAYPDANGLIIKGFSAATKLVQNDITADIFTINNTSAGWGIVIKDMNLHYASGTPGTVGSMAAVNLTSCENVRCERVFFSDCPMSFQSDGGSLQCGLFECTVFYDLKTGGEAPTPAGGQTMVQLQGSMDFVTGCIIGQQPVNAKEPGPPSCTGIALAGGANGRFITDTHLTDFQTCMTITDGVNSVYCVDTLFNAYGNALIIKPVEDTGKINDLHFTGCTFAASLTNAGGTAGVIINTNGGTFLNVSAIYFSNCSAYGFGLSGIEIDSGQNIVISGGQYSSNGQSPGSSTAAGIAVLTGSDITIVGVDCSGENGFWQQQTGAVVQPYGILVAGDVVDVLVVGCNLTGNATSGLYVQTVGIATPQNVYIRDCDATGYSSWSVAISVTSSATAVQVTNCAGYNDRSPAFIASPTLGPPSGTFYNYTYGYFGPVSFYVGTSAPGTLVLIGGHSTLLSTGAFYLPPGVSGQVSYGTTKPTFQVIGQ